MLNVLKDKTVYTRIILSVVPLTAVCATALSSLIAGVISFLATVLSVVLVSCLKSFLTDKTASFARIIIAVGIVGVLTMISSLFAKDMVESIELYLPLISVTTALLVSADFALGSTPKEVLGQGSILGAAASAFLFVAGILRELLGAGGLFGFDIYSSIFSPMEFFKSPAGALLITAVLTIVYNLLVKSTNGEETK